MDIFYPPQIFEDGIFYIWIQVDRINYLNIFIFFCDFLEGKTDILSGFTKVFSAMTGY